jgi:hypothetical protein
LKQELLLFFASNPPDELQNLDKLNANRLIDNTINNIILKIKLPNASDLISKIKISSMFYELTWEDISDEELLKWFVEKNLINAQNEDAIANFTDVFAVRK